MEQLRLLSYLVAIAAILFIFGVGSCTSIALQDDYHVNKEACEYVEKTECKQVWVKK